MYAASCQSNYSKVPAKLKEGFKKQDTLITLIGQGHNGMTENYDYRVAIQKILTR